MADEERLTNIVTSNNPCPICAGINGMTMTLAEWEASVYGLPGSDGRYCDGSCHCILIPDSLLGKFDWIDPNYIPRGDKGSDIGPIVEIFPNEKALADLMNDWNKRFGRLPPEIYRMPVKDGWAYLQKLYDRRIAGLPPAAPPSPPPAPLPPVVPPPAPAVPPATPAPAAIIPAPPPAAPAAAGADVTGLNWKKIDAGAIKSEEKIIGKFVKAKVKTEYGAVIDANGNEIFFKRGSAHRVSWNWRERTMYALDGSPRMIHNHPSGGCFSPADVSCIGFMKIREIVAASLKRRYTTGLPRNYATWDDYFAAQQAKGSFYTRPERLESRLETLYATKVDNDPAAQAARAAAKKAVEDSFGMERIRLEADMRMKTPGTEEYYQARIAYNEMVLKIMREGDKAWRAVWQEQLIEVFKDFAADAGLDFKVEGASYGD